VLSWPFSLGMFQPLGSLTHHSIGIARKIIREQVLII
jgi:hypothetical protein